MKIQAKICAALLACLSMVACKSVRPDMLDGEWAVTEIAGEKIEPTDQTPFIGFRVEAGEVYGFTGCNRLTGTTDFKKVAGGEADFDRLGMTRMLCMDDVYEQPFMEALNTAKHVSLEGDILTLTDENGTVVLRFSKKK
ncbi:MAG: META domain-containing protein [Clostridium sp.]|nr:META domain-containing protein [Clostridium sp.]